MKKENKPTRIFCRLAFVSIVAVYFLILVGGTVRSTGSGMGCPDWPKCFGEWIPPTSVDELPENYKEKYLEDRLVKNERIVDYLKLAGLDGLSDDIENNMAIKTETEFNATKTWIEYINRLIGVVIGLCILSTFIASLFVYKSDQKLTYISGFLLVLVGFQGWLGSIVVSTNLLPWMVTLHMVIALFIIALLIYLYFRSRKANLSVEIPEKRNMLNALLIIDLLALVLQVVFGTQVREAIDQLAASGIMRSNWISNMELTFYIHRSFSMIILALNAYLVYSLYRYARDNKRVLVMAKLLLFLVVLEILVGTGMAYAGVPAFLQPIHLLLAALLFGTQFLILLIVNQRQKTFKLPKALSIQ